MEQTLYYHGKTTDGRRFTIAGQVTKAGKIFRHKVISLGVSLCSRNDQFRKVVGRAKAVGRIYSTQKKGIATLSYPKDDAHLTKYFIESMSVYNTKTSVELQKDFNLSQEDDRNLVHMALEYAGFAD
jgi:hypothetical protein